MARIIVLLLWIPQFHYNHTQTEFYKTLYNQNELRIYFHELRVIFITILITFIPWTVLGTCEANDWLRAFVILHSPTLHYLKLAAMRKFNSLMTVGVMKRWDLFFNLYLWIRCAVNGYWGSSYASNKNNPKQHLLPFSVHLQASFVRVVFCFFIPD